MGSGGTTDMNESEELRFERSLNRLMAVTLFSVMVVFATGFLIGYETALHWR